MTYVRLGPAHSGHRPRFKSANRREAAMKLISKIQVRLEASEWDQVKYESQKCRAAKLTIVIILIAICASNVSATNHEKLHPRYRPFMTSIDDEIVMQVAAFASKLEHWLNCQRLAAATPTQLEESTRRNTDKDEMGEREREQRHSPALANFCPAHYDGHLCWPATGASQTAQLVCPQLNWQLISRAGADWSSSSPNKRHLTAPATSTSSNFSIATSTQREQHQQQLDLLPTNDKSQLTTATNNINANHKEQQSQLNGADGNSRLARRACQLQAQQQQLALWQTEADYSQCKLSARVQLDGQNNNNKAEQFDPTDFWIHLESSEADRALFGALVVELERSIEGGFDPYGEPDLLEQWTLCIGNIMRQQQDKAEELQRLSLHNNNNSEDKLQQQQQSQPYCPIIFDGWRCWPATKAGETAFVGCPSNQPGFTAERQAHKICTQNGTWYRHPETNRYWSNYTTCVDTVDLEFRTKILKIYVIGNTISLVALLLSLIIFITFKSLKCTRVTIHKNLFLSFITNNLMWIIWYTYVVSDASLLQSNPIECRLWHIVLHYFLVSNYFWMFCEGLYLHTLLVVAFVSEDKILKWFYILGWLTPLPITLAYAYNRSYDSQHTHFCWMEESPYNLILMAPIGVSLLVKYLQANPYGLQRLNLIFLINIVRLLVTKLRANNTPDAHQTRKAVRATLFLIPLLGLHYILTPFRPEPKSEWEFIYEIITAVCTSFQGLCVAMLFCFCNGEVMAVLRKKLDDKLWASEGFEAH